MIEVTEFEEGGGGDATPSSCNCGCDLPDCCGCWCWYGGHAGVNYDNRATSSVTIITAVHI